MLPEVALRIFVSVSALAIATHAGPAASQQLTGPGHHPGVMLHTPMATGTVTAILASDTPESFSVWLDAPPINAGQDCGAPTNGYHSEASSPGYHTLYAAALTAYVSRQQVTVYFVCSNFIMHINGISLP